MYLHFVTGNDFTLMHPSMKITVVQLAPCSSWESLLFGEYEVFFPEDMMFAKIIKQLCLTEWAPC